MQIIEKIKKGVNTPQGLAVILITPCVLIVFGVIIYPLFYAIYLSFHKVYLLLPGKTKFIGIDNYVNPLLSLDIWKAMGRTLYFTVLQLGIGLLCAIPIALVLNIEFKGCKALRSFLLLPWALAPVVNAILWKWVFNAEYGILNGLLYSLGLIHQYRSWLSQPLLALTLITLICIWKSLPLMTFFILATLQTIPNNLYESAKIDGANAWKSFVYITLPLIKPTLMILTILYIMWGFKVFDEVYIMTGGGPAKGTQVMTYYTYTETFELLHLGKGAAIAIIQTIIIFGLSVYYIRYLVQKKTEF